MNFQTEAALIRDAITLLSNALTERNLYETMNWPMLKCSSLEENSGNETLKRIWSKGRELLANIDYVSLN